MIKNMGTVDRMIRALAAVAIVACYVGGLISGTVAVVLGVFAVVFALTSTVAWCPAYLPLGISTCPRPPATK